MKLTTRQEVIKFTEEGKTVREIAALLGISTQAVYRHLRAEEAGMKSYTKTSGK
jgi:DNA-binding CsgD family transcriptional regulator